MMTENHSNFANRAFTLIELLVVISIISVLSSVVMVAVQGARTRGAVGAGQTFDTHTYSALYDDLVLSWDFDGDNSSPVKDQSGNGNNLTYSGTAGPSTQKNPFPSGKSFFMNPSGSPDLGGGSGIANTSTIVKNPTGDYTVSFWVYPVDSIGYFEYIANQFMLGITGGTWDFAHPNSTTFAFSVRVQNGAAQSVQTSALSVNTWTHVTGVCKGNRAGLYINGKLIAPTVALPAQCFTSNQAVEIKGTLVGGGSNHAYYIDNVRIYKQALPIAAIQSMYLADSEMFSRQIASIHR